MRCRHDMKGKQVGEILWTETDVQTAGKIHTVVVLADACVPVCVGAGVTWCTQFMSKRDHQATTRTG